MLTITLKRPDYSKYVRKINSLSDKLRQATTNNDVLSIFDSFNKIIYVHESYKTYCQLTQKLALLDQEANNEITYLQHSIAKFYNAINIFYSIFLQKEQIDVYKQKYEDHFIDKMETAKASNFGSEMSKLKNQERQLVRQYTLLVNKWQHENNFSLVLNRTALNSTSATTRKKVALEKNNLMQLVKGKIDELYSKLVICRNEQAKVSNKQSYAELSDILLMRIGYSRNDIAKLRENIRDIVVPYFNEYRTTNKKAINYADDRYFYRGFDDLNNESFNNMHKICHMVSKSTPEVGKFFEELINRNLFDIEPRPNKDQGASSHYIITEHMPFIFANVSKTPQDVRIIIHEVGHAYAAYVADKKNMIPMLFYPGQDGCEIHSTTLELLTLSSSNELFGNNSKRYIIGKIEEAIYLLCYAAEVDEFQEIVYNNNIISPQERDYIWILLDKKYRPWLNYEGLDYFAGGSGWQEQRHIIGSPFYFIDYALAQIVAFEILNKYLYDSNTGLKSYYDIINCAGSLSFKATISRGNVGDPFSTYAMHDIVKVSKEMLKL